MRQDIGKLLDDMVEEYNPPVSPNEEVSNQIDDLEKRLSDMIDKKLASITAGASTQPIADTATKEEATGDDTTNNNIDNEEKEN